MKTSPELPVPSARACDRCGCVLRKDQLRYIARIEVYAAPTSLEFSAEDLERDRSDEIAGLMQSCEGMTEEELMRDVHVEMRFDLCRSCQRELLRSPLPPLPDGA